MAHNTTTNLAVQDYYTTTLTSNVAVNDTVINLAAVPTGTEGYLVIDPTNATTREVIYYNAKGASTVTCPDATGGSSRGLGGTTVQTHNSGTLVGMNFTGEHFNALQNGQSNLGLVQHQQASHAANYIVSGCTIATSGSLTSTLASGTVYINGKRFTVPSTSITVTASKDTYIYVTEGGDGTITVVQNNNVANNAASPAASINSDGSAGILVAILISSGSAITTVNQGSPTAVLPIASSVAYSVTDSLGNPIYPTSPTPGLLGYRQITTNATTTSTSAAIITGLSAAVIVPAGKRVKIITYTYSVQVTGTSGEVRIYRGATASALTTNLQGALSASGSNSPVTVVVFDSPGAGTWYYSAAFFTNNVIDTLTFSGAATNPGFISVELV